MSLLNHHSKLLINKSIQSIKFQFLKICEQCPLAMAFAIPTNSQAKLFMKPRKLFIAEQGKILDSYNLSQIVRWTIDREKFVFDVKGSTNVHATVSHAIYTEFAPICSSYLANLTKGD